MKKNFLFAIILCLTVTGCLALNTAKKEYRENRETFNTGAKAYKEGNYKEALSVLLPLAEKGHAKAQFAVGVLYKRGRGIEQNLSTAFNWYTKSASQGYAKAQTSLALMYAHGRSVPQDAEEALRLLTLAAIQSHGRAYVHLFGINFKGIGKPKDLVEAYKWLHIAHAKGAMTARKTKVKIEPLMTTEQIEEAKRRAKKWLETH